MIGGIFVLAIFAAAWAVAGLVYLGAQWPWFFVPIGISIAALIVAKRFFASIAPRSESEEKSIGRLVMIWTGVEGVAIFVAINAATNLHRPDLVLAAICAVVGLHFIPLARGLPQRAYYITGAALVALALAGILDAQAVPPAAVGLGAALILWLSILGLFYRASGMIHLQAQHERAESGGL